MLPDVSTDQPLLALSPHDGWGAPLPLSPTLSSDIPYPINALPASVRDAVTAYQRYGQQPMPLVACSALANLSLACQALANIARDRYLVSPLSLYFLVIASSGERKSAVDTVLSRTVRDWETQIRQQRAHEVHTATVLHQAWCMERDGVLAQIKRLACTGDNVSFLKAVLTRLSEQEPEMPMVPTLYFEDATQEALAVHLATGWPSAALWSDEAGIVLGSHSMQSNPTRFVALLNRLWDGKPFTTHRKTSHNFVIEHRRLTVNLMLQPMLFPALGSAPTGISRHSGFMARCLLAFPTSAMGQRFYQEPPHTLEGLQRYEQRLQACLAQTASLTAAGCIDLPTLELSTAAKRHWVRFFNHIEAGLADNGQWIGIKDFASKASENVARLAALLHLFEGKLGDIDTEQVEQAIEIIHWHLQETRRLVNDIPAGQHTVDAHALLRWLTAKEQRTITVRDIQRLSPLRDRSRRDAAIALLVEHSMARLLNEGGKTWLMLHPCVS